jgi:hypothetical protein
MKVVHVKLDKSDVYVGRPSYWGNPYTVATHGRGRAVLLFEDYVRRTPQFRERVKKVLSGKILACWCAPRGGVEHDAPLICHAQVLVRITLGEYDEPIG